MIKSSSARQVQTLIADLSAAKAATREGAVARLTVVGARAVDAVSGVATDSSASSEARQAALRVLEGIRDPRSLDVAIRILDDLNPEVAVAAVGVARALLREPRGLSAVDRLTSVALDQGRAAAVRIAAINALSDLDKVTVQPLLDALASDPEPDIAALVKGTGSLGAPAHDPAALLRNAVDHDLPSDPAAFRRAIAAAGSSLPLAQLHRLLERVRDHEGAQPQAQKREWTTARAAVHVVLARQGSRLGVYDLRETLETSSEALPVEFLTALSEVGDASCLEPIAEAYARAVEPGRQQEWWTSRLSDAFRTISTREHVTKRSAVVKRIEKRWPQILAP